MRVVLFGLAFVLSTVISVPSHAASEESDEVDAENVRSKGSPDITDGGSGGGHSSGSILDIGTDPNLRIGKETKPIVRSNVTDPQKTLGEGVGPLYPEGFEPAGDLPDKK